MSAVRWQIVCCCFFLFTISLQLSTGCQQSPLNFITGTSKPVVCVWLNKYRQHDQRVGFCIFFLFPFTHCGWLNTTTRLFSMTIHRSFASKAFPSVRATQSCSGFNCFRSKKAQGWDPIQGSLLCGEPKCERLRWSGDALYQGFNSALCVVATHHTSWLPSSPAVTHA